MESRTASGPPISLVIWSIIVCFISFELVVLLKAKVLPASFVFGLFPHLFEASSSSLHVESNSEEAKWKEDEKEEEEPKACGHVLWINHSSLLLDGDCFPCGDNINNISRFGV